MDSATPITRAALGRILLVDDEPSVVEMLRDYFLDAGYHVDGALSGRDALLLLQQDRPDIVILDLYMPGLHGADVLRRILAFDPTIPVIIATGNHDLALAYNALALGAVDYVTKPFDFGRLSRAVATYLGRGPGRHRSGRPAPGPLPPR